MSADYGRSLRFGVFPAPTAAGLDEVLRVAAMADERGLDLIGIQDHPYQRRFLDTWMLMATVLARTERVTVFPDVANLPLRPPAVLAQAAASLDIISGGRFQLGLGAGGFWEAVAAMGGPARTPAEAAGALREAVEVIRLMWSEQRSVRYDGRHYRLAGARPGPLPEHGVEIWLGVGGPRLLEFLGRSADGWVPSSPYFPPDTLPGMHARIDAGAAEAGRDPASIRRIYNVSGSITDRRSEGFLHGPVTQWVDELTMLAVERGMDSFVFWPADAPARQVARFAEEVAPAVRCRVAEHRGEEPDR